MEQKINPPAAPRKGMAIASLVIGILSIPTFGLLMVGAITGLVLGLVALKKNKRDPSQYGGRGIAMAGIATSGFSILFAFLAGIIAAVAIPNLLRSAQTAREVAALQEIKNIGGAQLQYSVTKGRGKFADLRTLAAEGLIDWSLASGEKGGYLFASEPLSIEGMPAMFDTTARPKAIGSFGTGNRSFYSNETMIIYEAEGAEPPRADLLDRVPENGVLLRQ
ncbi:MAG: DUF4190 domain-containing protein [Blastocatellia bacterium]|nr:DUF4190 domain-containing protein [Blastocatellia bacterium]